MRYLYEVDVDDPMLYDLVVSTERFGYDAAVEMNEVAVRHPVLATTEHAKKALSDLKQRLQRQANEAKRRADDPSHGFQRIMDRS